MIRRLAHSDMRKQGRCKPVMPFQCLPSSSTAHGLHAEDTGTTRPVFFHGKGQVQCVQLISRAQQLANALGQHELLTWAALPCDRLHAAVVHAVRLKPDDDAAGVARCVPPRVACVGRRLSASAPAHHACAKLRHLALRYINQACGH